jgi:DNA-binding NarL/FixJ family response regulator
MPQEVTVIVAEGLRTFRHSVLRLLAREFCAQVSHVGTDLEEALQVTIGTRPALAVVDRDLPGPDVLGVVASIRRHSPQTLVILTGAAVSEADVAAAHQAGAQACVSKRTTPDELRRAVAGVLMGYRVSPHVVFSRGPVRHDHMAVSDRPVEQLTMREMQVLAQIGRGLSTKEIATVLNVSWKTVDRHRANVMGKLDIHDRVLLARYAIREGLVSPRRDDDAE